MFTYIYTLSNPTTNEIRYVGKTDRLSKRLQEHCTEKSKTHRTHWIQSLLKQGLKPKLEVIDQTTKEWEPLEQYWIAQLKAWGFNLTNATVGGDGIGKGKKMPPRTKKHLKNIKASKIKNGTWRQTHNDDTRKILSATALKGHMVTSVAREKRQKTIDGWSQEQKQSNIYKRTERKTHSSL